jgi:hypothetical protein
VLLASLSNDTITSLTQVATLIVVAGTAVAAIAQLRHLRASNELEALLTLTEQLRQPDLRHALAFVQFELETRLRDPAFRADLAAIGYVDARAHPEMDACNWFNQVGTLVKNGLIDERTFLDIFSRLVTYYWGRLEPVVALLRRERGEGQYENFEYLALLARRWQAKHPRGAYPRRVPRLQVADIWLEADA